jgi:hypothetical protein
MLQLGKLNKNNRLEGVEIYNRGLLLDFKSPTLSIHKEFTMNSSMDEFGMNMITINRDTGKYEENSGVVMANN